MEEREKSRSLMQPWLGSAVCGGSTSYCQFQRDALGTVTNEVEKFCLLDGSPVIRTNSFIYSTNGIDLIKIIDVLGSQVSSNFYNSFHQVLTNYNALDEKTIFTYDATTHKPTSVLSPAGLTTTFGYYSQTRLGPGSARVCQRHH
jgi:hypothetical protein